jgi:hypothetical protein
MKLPLEAMHELRSNNDMPTENFKAIKLDANLKLEGFSDFSSIEYLNSDMKEKIKYIRYIEKMARGSSELRYYIDYLKENTDMTRCCILKGVDSEGASIELHHYPFTLFDISRIVLDKALLEESDVSSFDLVMKIVELHYRGLIGLVPLSNTVHELAHAGKVAVSLCSVFGDWQGFVKEYAQFLSGEDIENLKLLIKTSSTPALENENRRKLKVLKRCIVLTNKGE